MSDNDPCASCPYRKDVPSGIWHESEYEKILDYDKETSDQPLAQFGCHKNDGTICRGWLHCHGINLLAVRLRWTPEVGEMIDAGTSVALFESAKAASDHGRKDIGKPSRMAERFIAMLKRRKQKRK